MHSWTIGDVTVTRVVELQIVGGTKGFFPQATPEETLRIDWLIPHFADERGRLKMNFQALLVESEGTKIIVDTCFGNDKERSIPVASMLSTDFLERVKAAGFDRHEVDIVLCTHMHSDHVGWNTMLVDGEWVPTFPNARYLVAADEYAHWVDGPNELRFGDVLGDSVTPIEAAGLLDKVDQDHRVTSEVWLEPTPGHTPFHVGVRISSGGEEAFITGDCIHHPFQIARPDWSGTSDEDPDQAHETRARLLAEHGDRSTLIIGTHWAAPTAGYFRSDGDTYRLDPVPQDDPEDEQQFHRRLEPQ